MSSWLWIAFGVFVVGFIAAGTWRPGGMRRALAHARRTGDVAQIVVHIEQSPGSDRATMWDNAIGELWQAYAREAAARLIVEATSRSDAQVLQYWIRQVLEIEPEIAAEVFDQEYLEAHFKPDVAAQCGRCGSCGCG